MSKPPQHQNSWHWLGTYKPTFAHPCVLIINSECLNEVSQNWAAKIPWPKGGTRRIHKTLNSMLPSNGCPHCCSPDLITLFKCVPNYWSIIYPLYITSFDSRIELIFPISWVCRWPGSERHTGGNKSRDWGTSKGHAQLLESAHQNCELDMFFRYVGHQFLSRLMITVNKAVWTPQT